MKDYHQEYYEQSVLWDYDYLKISKERERIEEVVGIIPFDACSVLDVGCGNGVFVNTIIKIFPHRCERIVALDPSEEALKHVNTEKIKGVIACLPFESESFDLVVCLEVLEHLGQKDFERGISELQRVSKKYIIITVPNDQDLESSQVMCPRCYCRFHPYCHMRRFDKNSLKHLFENFELIEAKEIGPARKRRRYNRQLRSLARWYTKPAPYKTSVCPQCGYQPNKNIGNLRNDKESTGSCLFSFVFSVFRVSFKLIDKVISLTEKKRPWLLALYEKAGG